MTKKLISVLLCAFVSPAIADVDHRNLSHIAGWVAQVKADLGSGVYQNGSNAKAGTENVAECKAVLADARQKGMKTVKGYKPLGPYGGKKIEEGGYEFEVTLEQGQKVCDDAQYVTTVLGARIALEAAANIIFMTDGMWDQAPSEESMTLLLGQVDDCNKQVDAMIAAKVPASQPYVIKTKSTAPGLSTTVGDLKTTVCERARKELMKFEQAEREAEEARKAPYIKAGIKDDKLWLMLTYGTPYLPGGRSSEDLKVYAKANVLFLHLSSDPDALNIVTHTIRKHKFKGNKLVDQTEKTYRKKYGERLPGSVFK